jgi:hypothetical protein
MPRRSARLVALAVIVAACGSASEAGDSGGPVQLTEDGSAYLAAVGEIQDQVEALFEEVNEELMRSYPTREVFFSAIGGTGYQGVSQSALVRAEALSPAPEFEDDHEIWLAHRTFAVDSADALAATIEERDLQKMLSVLTENNQEWGKVLLGTSREFCLAVSIAASHCPSDGDLPGGDYGVEVYDLLRADAIAAMGLFDFIGDMSPEERSLRLDEVQPRIEANLKAGGDAFKEIDPPDKYRDEHQAFITYFEDQYETAVAITEANAERDNTRVLQLFDRSNVVFQAVLDALSPEYEEIAAPFIGEE